LAIEPQATSSLLPIGIVADVADAIAALLVCSTSGCGHSSIG
jgi:hypothetical protein